MSKKIIIIDIDSTLWPMFQHILENTAFISKIPIEEVKEHWTGWNSWEKFLDPKEWYSMISEMHNNQDMYIPFPEARDFLHKLKDKFHIIIATHRKEESRRATEKFLKQYDLYHDELHISISNKHELFNKAHYIVDDCPDTIYKAINRGVIPTGLKYVYNKNVPVPMFSNLNQVYNYIMEIES